VGIATRKPRCPLIKLASQLEKWWFCGAKIFDDRQVEAVHALVDAARHIARDGTIEVTISMKA
jgi:hypothetical protein